MLVPRVQLNLLPSPEMPIGLETLIVQLVLEVQKLIQNQELQQLQASVNQVQQDPQTLRLAPENQVLHQALEHHQARQRKEKTRSLKETKNAKVA